VTALPTSSVILVVALALGFDYINGFHDAANSIATVVSTRVLSPRVAVLWVDADQGREDHAHARPSVDRSTGHRSGRPGGRPRAHRRASSTMLKGVSVARRRLAKPPPFTTTSRMRASPAWAPRAGPPCDSECGTHSIVEAE